MAHSYCLTLLAIVLSLVATGGRAQEPAGHAVARLETRLARLELNAGSAIDGRSLARIHRELWSLRTALGENDAAASRDARRRLARLSQRLRDLTQRGAATSAGIATAGTASISGVVTADGGTPVPNVLVTAYLIDGDIAFALTDAVGRYQVTGLAAGNYKAFTDNRLGFLDELYDGAPCPLGSCDVFSQGTTIVVTDGQATSGIDFSLSPGGRIAGRVTDAATGTPIAGAQVDIVSDEYATITTVADADGRYVPGHGLPTGTYRIDAWGPGYVTEMFDDIPCSTPFVCDFSLATPITVVAGAVTGGIDVALDKGGTISGRVVGSDTGTGIPGVFVYIFDAETTQTVGQALTDADGRYRSLDGLATGTYWLRVFAGDAGYLDEGYDNVPCDTRCFLPLGVTAVAVTLGQDTSGIDFTLDRGAVITGRVTDGNTGQPLPNVVVQATTITQDPFWNNFGTTDASGVYRIEALGTGTYRAVVDGRDGYLGEVWRELDCYGPDCFTIPSTPIAAQAGLTVGGIDFTPIRGGSISGRVVDHLTNAPLLHVAMAVYDSTGRELRFGILTDADGGYTIAGLPAGFYFVLADTFIVDPYVSELYGGAACSSLDCTVTRGRPVRVALGVETSGIDFRLDKGGTISGRMSDAVTGEPLSFAAVTVYDTVTGSLVAFGSTDESGQYSTHPALPRGQYQLIAQAPGYRAEVYDDVPCADEGCYLILGRRVKITPPGVTTGIDFALTPVPTSDGIAAGATAVDTAAARVRSTR